MTTATQDDLFARMRKLSPVVTGGIARMRQASYTDGDVSKKHKLLTALVISIVIRCEPCINAYAQMSKDAGATEEELIEFLNVAMTMQGCPGEEWAMKALAAFEGGQAEDESCCSIED